METKTDFQNGRLSIDFSLFHQFNINILGYEKKNINEENNSISIDMLKKGSYDMYAVNPFETYDILTTCKNSVTPSTQYIRIKGHDNVGVFSQNLEYGKSNKEEVIPINESIKHYYMEVISREEIE